MSTTAVRVGAVRCSRELDHPHTSQQLTQHHGTLENTTNSRRLCLRGGGGLPAVTQIRPCLQDVMSLKSKHQKGREDPRAIGPHGGAAPKC